MNILKKILHRLHGGLSCEEANQFLTDYFEGVLDGRIRRAFEAHIRMCPDCQTYMEQYRLTVALVRSAPPPPVPPELVEETLAFLRKRNAGSAD